MIDILREGRLSQRCPECGLTEAAGFHCSRCFTPTEVKHWYAQSAGRPRSAGKPRKTGLAAGRPRKVA